MSVFIIVKHSNVMLAFLPYYLKAKAMGVSAISLKSQKYGRTGKRACPPSPRINILTTDPPILLPYRLKPVFIILEDMEDYLEINSSRKSSKTHKEFPGW